ncbi:heterokaryon incompatibility protein-domain-containing protein, partial [Microdochium trichocladiopsis]
MRLINVATLQLEDFVSSHETPPYAILSHTWEGREEVSYLEWLAAGTDPSARDCISSKRGYAKILGAVKQAQAHDCAYLWVDTNCIDKSSSAELSEAINSMFTWYKRSKVCLVHLADVAALPVPQGSESAPGPDPGSGSVDAGPDLERSRWFRRGWTLQELLAPRRMIFYSADWQQVGTGSTLETRLSAITGISAHYLRKDNPLWTAGVAEKLSWLAGRTTTRQEDMAYCMLGIFRINMPLLYGEGPRAFVRLQEEIIRRTNDHTIFAW